MSTVLPSKFQLLSQWFSNRLHGRSPCEPSTLQAVNVWQSNAACGGADASTYVSQVNTLVETATTASESLSPTDINAAKDAANAAGMPLFRCPPPLAV